MMCCGALLCHTWLGAPVEDCVTCSDASQRGGAVAISEQLTDYGASFVHHLHPKFQAVKIPVVLISLFNGIGGSCRSYDVAGLKVQNIITADIHKPGNRVTSRRWGEAVMEEDVRLLTKARLEELLLQCEPFEEIHLWAGFPCVDLSKAKANRQNLEGATSSLIFEAVRILGDLKELYPQVIIHFVIENVASMDVSARDAISDLLDTKPFKVDPSNQAPMARPRFCWTSLELFEVSGLRFTHTEGYIEVEVQGKWPNSAQWLDEGASECNEGVVYPTCMKAIRRERPPPKPAGISRTDARCRARWEAEDFRFPPYQYKSDYLLWDEKLQRCRLLNANEREILMGYGAGHTTVAWSASQAKQNPQGFEDERCSLIGDSFAIQSFMIFAAFAGYKWSRQFDMAQMNHRVGLPPGVSVWQTLEDHLPGCPMQTSHELKLEGESAEVHHLNRILLQRTNHTGSDVRIITGDLLAPKKYPRQSVQSSWWRWRPVFATRWKFEEHINALEIRAVYLSLLWKARQRRLCSRRSFHITDSYVAMSTLSKGRTSSHKLQPLIRKISALLLAGQLQLILAHVDSSDNPTDAASREFEGHQA